MHTQIYAYIIEFNSTVFHTLRVFPPLIEKRRGEEDKRGKMSFKKAIDQTAHTHSSNGHVPIPCFPLVKREAGVTLLLHCPGAGQEVGTHPWDRTPGSCQADPAKGISLF